MDKTNEFFKKACFSFDINCNDTFYYASADAETICREDLDIFVEAYTKYGFDGVNALCALHRGEEVIKELINENYKKAKDEYKDYKFGEL